MKFLRTPFFIERTPLMAASRVLFIYFRERCAVFHINGKLLVVAKGEKLEHSHWSCHLVQRCKQKVLRIL